MALREAFFSSARVLLRTIVSGAVLSGYDTTGIIWRSFPLFFYMAARVSKDRRSFLWPRGAFEPADGVRNVTNSLPQGFGAASYGARSFRNVAASSDGVRIVTTAITWRSFTTFLRGIQCRDPVSAFFRGSWCDGVVQCSESSVCCMLCPTRTVSLQSKTNYQTGEGRKF